MFYILREYYPGRSYTDFIARGGDLTALRSQAFQKEAEGEFVEIVDEGGDPHYFTPVE